MQQKQLRELQDIKPQQKFGWCFHFIIELMNYPQRYEKYFHILKFLYALVGIYQHHKIKNWYCLLT